MARATIDASSIERHFERREGNKIYEFTAVPLTLERKVVAVHLSLKRDTAAPQKMIDDVTAQVRNVYEALYGYSGPIRYLGYTK